MSKRGAKMVATSIWWVIPAAVAIVLARWVAARLALRRQLPTGGLQADYEYCLRTLELDPFEVDHILTSIVLRDEYRISGQRLGPGDVAVDVGAHAGVFSLWCHRKGSRSIHAFEPGERNFGRLRARLGALPGFHCARAAVWRSDLDTPVLVRLSRIEHENTGGNSVLAGGDALDFHAQQPIAAVAEEAVPALALDAILGRFERVKLLKVDCEGSEFPILLTSRLLDRVERIVGEIHECGQEMMPRLMDAARVAGYAEYRASALVTRLESFGFAVTVHSGQGSLCLFDAWRPAR
jgi:FkbM family methyltransferase